MKIRYYGHIGQGTGYAHAAEHLCLAISKVPEVKLEIRPLAPRDSVKLDAHTQELAKLVVRDENLDPFPDVVVVHTLPLDCENVMRMARFTIDPRETPRTVAYTTWEAASLAPEPLRRSLATFDEVWAPSEETAELLDVPDPQRLPARVVPHAFDDSQTYRTDHFARDPAHYHFLYVGAWTSRKNPSGLLRAFCHEFTKADMVTLLIHAAGTDEAVIAAAVAQTGIPQAELPRVKFSNKHISSEEIDRLFVASDCFVTATRGEAWNLPAFQALLHGRHVIYTAGTGGDFLRESSAHAVDSYHMPAFVDVRSTATQGGQYSFVTVQAQGLDCRSEWREPHLSGLAAAMRAAARMSLRTSTFPGREKYTHAAVADRVMTILKES